MKADDQPDYLSLVFAVVHVQRSDRHNRNHHSLTNGHGRDRDQRLLVACDGNEAVNELWFRVHIAPFHERRCVRPGPGQLRCQDQGIRAEFDVHNESGDSEDQCTHEVRTRQTRQVDLFCEPAGRSEGNSRAENGTDRRCPYQHADGAGHAVW